MTVAAALEQVADVLAAAGIFTAWTDSDVATPVALLRIGAVTDAGPPMAETDTLTTVYVYWIPVRGPGYSTRVDADDLDALYAALHPIVWDTLTATATTVMVGLEQWPCYRLDVTLLGQMADAP